MPVLADTLHADLRLGSEASFPFDPAWEERALYILEGEIEIAGDRCGPDQLLVLRLEDEITLKAGPRGTCAIAFRR